MPRQRGLTRRLARFGAWGGRPCWPVGCWPCCCCRCCSAGSWNGFKRCSWDGTWRLNIRLSELTLERYPPSLISELTGLELAVMEQPAAPDRETQASAQRRQELRQVLCSRIPLP